MKLTGPITHQWIELITETETVLSMTSPTHEETSSESDMTPSGETLLGAKQPIPLLMMKATKTMVAGNVHTMYETSKTTQVTNEMHHFDIGVLGICESRWNGAGRITLATGEQLVYSGHDNEQHTHTDGVAFMMSKLASKALIEWVPVSPGPSLHASTLWAERTQEFYDSLQGVLDHTP